MSEKSRKLTKTNNIKLTKFRNDIFFIALIWLSSRIVILLGMFVVSLLFNNIFLDESLRQTLPAVNSSEIWNNFTHFDGTWYERIANSGYEFDGTQPRKSVAFFPMFPLVVHGVMTLGIPYAIAAVLVNNLAFFGALIILYSWVEKRHGTVTAKWTTAVISWCPYSIFTTIAYTEALFILSTTAALKAFDNCKHLQAALWGAVATATRVTGSALVPAFLFVAWKEKRPKAAYFAGLFAAIGILSFSIYCAIRFNDALAFVHIQQAWGVKPGSSNLENWSTLLVKSTFVNGFFPAINSIAKISIFIGGFILLWNLRKKLSPIAFIYGCCYFALIFASGATQSVIRFVYGIVPLSIALGIILTNHRRLGSLVIILFALILLVFAVISSQGGWIG